MKLLSQEDISAVAGGYDIVYVAATANDPTSAASVAEQVSQLLNGQLDPAGFMQSLVGANIQINQFLYFSAQENPLPPPPPCPAPSC
jgi:hypothetical protein